MAKAPTTEKTQVPMDRVKVPKTKERTGEGRKKTGRRTKTIPAPRVRPSITPGTVLILIAGPYKGKRVVCLKVLPSGNIMVTGPFKINGFPLRRMNPRFVIATSTKIPLDGVDVSKYDDSFFKKATKGRKPPKEKENVFMSQGEVDQRVIPEERKQAQIEVDTSLLEFLSKPENSLLRQYMRTPFSLTSKMYPHLLKF